MISGPHVENDGICAVWGGGVADDVMTVVVKLNLGRFLSFSLVCLVVRKRCVCIGLAWYVWGVFPLFFFRGIVLGKHKFGVLFRSSSFSRERRPGDEFGPPCRSRASSALRSLRRIAERRA